MEDLAETRPTPAQVQFHLEEYRATKAEILLILRLLYEGFIWCVVTTAVAAGYVMYAVKDENLRSWPGLQQAAFGPLALTVILGFGFVHQGLALWTYSAYLTRLDGMLAVKQYGLQFSRQLTVTKSIGTAGFGVAFALLLWATWTFGWSVNAELAIPPVQASANTP
jgi:hypothetical protein